MATNALNLFNRFSSISREPAAHQLRLLLGLAASVALGTWLVQWALTPDYTPLYGELSPAASSEVVQALEQSGVRYTIHSQTGIISVPYEQVRETRLKLAAEGLPQGQSKGFDILQDENGMGVSSFMEQARFDRALEQELASTIASLDGVKATRVHLALPKQSAFLRKKDKPAASVLVGLYPGSELTDRQLAGIVHLVAFSVPGLEAEQVSVVDNFGKLLSSQNRGDEFSVSNDNFSYTRQLEASYVENITRILTPILGSSSIRAQVAAEVDFTRMERTSETYAPEKSLRSEQLIEDVSAVSGAGGIPGTLSNQAPEQAQVVAAGELGEAPVAPTRSSKREVRNYELDKTISHVRETPGTVKKLSVAVVVDYHDQADEEGVMSRVPLSAERLEEITALVKEAVGFNAARGDSVNVVNASFVSSPELEAMPAPSLLEQDWIWRMGKLLLAGVSILLTVFMVLRPLLSASSAPAVALNSLKALGGAGQDGMDLSEDRVTLGQQRAIGLLPGGEPAYQQQLNMARSMVEGEPERAAHVVKNWVSSDG